IAIDPRSIELHEMLRDLYTDVGDRDGAIEEMLTMVDIYVEFERPDYALAVLLNVLDEEQSCDPAWEMLIALVEQMPDLRDELPEHLVSWLDQHPSSGAGHSAQAASARPLSADSAASSAAGSRPPVSAPSAAPASAPVVSSPSAPQSSSDGMNLAPPPPPSSGASSSSQNALPPPELSLEEALEEVEFFAS